MSSEIVTQRKRAYFIDDDKDFLEMLSLSLNHSRFEICTCVSESGYKTIDDIIFAKPDVLFIDFHLPQASGTQIISILKKIEALSHVPIYIVTGYPAEKLQAFLEGVEHDGLIFKNDELVAKIIKALDAAA